MQQVGLRQAPLAASQQRATQLRQHLRKQTKPSWLAAGRPQRQYNPIKSLADSEAIPRGQLAIKIGRPRCLTDGRQSWKDARDHAPDPWWKMHDLTCGKSLKHRQLSMLERVLDRNTASQDHLGSFMQASETGNGWAESSVKP